MVEEQWQSMKSFNPMGFGAVLNQMSVDGKRVTKENFEEYLKEAYERYNLNQLLFEKAELIHKNKILTEAKSGVMKGETRLEF